LLWFGFLLYTAGLISGFFTGQPLPVVKMVCAFAVWLLYERFSRAGISSACAKARRGAVRRRI
jgi:hypothetical protein